MPAIKLKLSRSWVWERKAGRVFYDGTDKEGKPVKVTYLRSELSKKDAVVKGVVDPGFMNDQYWLVFPFHVYWRTGAKVEDTGTQKLGEIEVFRINLLLSKAAMAAFSVGYQRFDRIFML